MVGFTSEKTCHKIYRERYRYITTGLKCLAVKASPYLSTKVDVKDQVKHNGQTSVVCAWAVLLHLGHQQMLRQNSGHLNTLTNKPKHHHQQMLCPNSYRATKNKTTKFTRMKNVCSDAVQGADLVQIWRDGHEPFRAPQHEESILASARNQQVGEKGALFQVRNDSHHGQRWACNQKISPRLNACLSHTKDSTASMSRGTILTTYSMRIQHSKHITTQDSYNIQHENTAQQAHHNTGFLQHTA